jgi:hypothetical protein
MLAGDLIRTVTEYQTLMANYRQSVTLTTSYSAGLKQEVENSNVPTLYSAEDSDTPVIKINDTNYDASNLPAEIQHYVSELVRANSQKSNLEYRLRQLDAARVSFTKAIQDEVNDSKPAPMDPQPSND